MKSDDKGSRSDSTLRAQRAVDTLLTSSSTQRRVEANDDIMRLVEDLHDLIDAQRDEIADLVVAKPPHDPRKDGFIYEPIRFCCDCHWQTVPANSGVLLCGYKEIYREIPMPEDISDLNIPDWCPLRTLGVNKEEGKKPKIYVYSNTGLRSDWIHGIAMAEDGHILAEHISSTRDFFLCDMGLRGEDDGVPGDNKHANYRNHYPDGYELVLVEDPRSHEGLQAAYACNQELKRKAEEKEGEE